MTGPLDLAGLGAIRLRGLHRKMTQALMHPVLSHALDEVVDPHGLNAFQRVLYEPYEVARRQDPDLTFRDFLVTPEAQALATHLLGTDYYELVTRTGGESYFAARRLVLRSLRDTHPPVATWMSWGHWRPGLTPADLLKMADLSTGMPRLLPVDFPAIRFVKGVQTAAYPSWSTARKRLFMNLGYAELVRRLPEGADIPDDLAGGALLARLQLPRDPVPRPLTGMPEVTLSDLQAAQMLSTGRSPAVEARLLGAGEPRPVGFKVSPVRNAEDARWELAARLGDTDLADEVAFEAALARHPKKAKDTTLPADEAPPQPVNPNHPVTQLSNADLVALARRQAGAPTIATRVCELEHRRPQRSARSLERVLGALGQAVDVSHIRHLCGLCDPHNLKLVTPQGHADVDFRARLNGSGSRWAPNPARARSIEARRGPPDDTVDDVPSDPLYENLEELDEVPDGLVPAPKEVLPAPADQVPAHFVQDFDEDEDWPRSVNFFFGFAAYHLEPVARLLQASRGNIPAALQGYKARHGHDLTESYNHLAGCLNAAVNSYGMDKSLLVDLVPTITRSTP